MTSTLTCTWASQKGGVCKSSGTLGTAGAAAILVGRLLRVAFVDLDPDAYSTTMGLGQEPSAQPLTAAPIPITHPVLKGGQLLLFPGGDAMHDASEDAVAAHLARCAASADILFVDTPPNCRHPAVRAALRAATVVVAPVLPEFQALAGMEKLLATCQSLDVKAPVRALFSRWEASTVLARDVHRELVTAHPGMALSTTVPKDQRAAEAPAAGLPVTLYAPHSPSAVAYRAALYEIAATGGLRLPKETV